MKYFRKITKRFLTVTLAAALVLAVFSAIPTTEFDVGAATRQQLQDRINELNQRERDIRARIDGMRGEQANAEARARELESQLRVMEERVRLITDRVNHLNAEISRKNAEIEQRETAMEERRQLLMSRLRAIYIAGATSEFLVLLSADDYGSFLEQNDVMARITGDTQELIDELTAEVEEINESRRVVEANRAEAVSLQQQLVTERRNLTATYNEANAAARGLAATRDRLGRETTEIQAQRAQAERQMNDIIRREMARQQAQNVPSVTVPGSDYGFAWPFGGAWYISSGFGPRWGRLHGGIDITSRGGAFGRPIFAMAPGRVFHAGWLGAYGITAMIDHGFINGRRFVSLYAHASSLSVSNGQQVSRGQQIGRVGSTGRSTGPHLHFEIRVNGGRQNPMNFFRNF